MARPGDGFDLDAYLERVGLRGRPGLAELHRAHMVAIPFENLDPHRGVPVSLEPEALMRKLVLARRGGYCFEHNLLLAAALRELGAEVAPMLARVRLGRGPGVPRPRTHLVLRVAAEGGIWLADAGFGPSALLEPISFEPDPERVHEQSGWRFRLVREGGEHVLELASPSSPAGWEQLYGFVPEPVPLIDIETSNWFTATHPRSIFVAGLQVCAHRPDGTFGALSGWPEPVLSQSAPGARSEAPVAAREVPALLADRFGLPGFALDEERQRLV
ncbi:MAG: arylamine N-acetyltransferase family protein [Solirubrobacteraceae bacterium]